VRELRELTAAGGVERSFAADGVKRREVQWVVADRSGASERGRRITTLDQEHHESGKLVRERRWRPGERGAELVSEQRWYLNGQPKELIEFTSGDGRQLRRETGFHDNGRKASEAFWIVAGGSGRGPELATGVHKAWDAEARLRSERSYDERGRITREREYDGTGKLVRDDEVFEDGSRKAFGR
jgi:antitoxin component YwqK of YwqJK toxin-antitoxin module